MVLAPVADQQGNFSVDFTAVVPIEAQGPLEGLAIHSAAEKLLLRS
jgi:hypothetical protein